MTGELVVASEVIEAAADILSGDDSRRAAAALEAALHTHHPHDLAFEDLLEALALYAPAIEPMYTNHRQLCSAIRESPISSKTRGRAGEAT